MKKEEKPKEVSFYDTREYLAEEIFDPLRIPEKQFCLYDKTNGTFAYQEKIELENGKTIIPIQSPALIDKGVVFLPSEPKEYTSEETLIAAIKEFIHKYVDIHPFYENLAAYYVLMSWRYDELSVVPYLRALGDYGSGKTRFVQTIGALCYKPMFLAGATSDAYLFRVIELFGGTLVINELERVNSDLQSQITIILNNGYEKGMPVGRIEGETKREPRTFDVFCPKIISTRQRFKDLALESRIISIPMRQTSRKDIPSFIDACFWGKAQELRNKLLMYRFRNYGNFVLQEKEQEEKRQKLQILEPRLKQTLLPIFYIINGKQLEEEFINFAKDYQGQLITDRGSELSALVFKKLYVLFQDNKDVRVKQVSESVNIEIEKEKDKLTSNRVGKIIRNDLGFKTHEGTGGVYYVIRNDKQLEYLVSRYGISESPLTPQTPLSDSDSKEDLGDLGDLSKVKETELKIQLKPCYACGSTKFWKTKDDAINCSVCHPPASEGDVKEWIEAEGA